jgi:DNA-binding PucR family transcriptional regulator
VPDGLRIGAGPIAAGAAGFRRSLLGARAACQAACHEQDCRWCDYQDASPVTLLTGDEQQARWFVDEVLGELGRDEPWHATLRETLRLYLARGRSRQQVAAAMYINRNTVAYRVQKASQLLGRPIDEDAFDLRLALEIARTTGGRPA